ncbi:uncharacterized protein LOC131066126 isoform X2 [Cryptomeria japonica]|uniref:uncharacterized protein LOC131066126 isoform X2 n=1 Tax=Cryptomeria japonica TaxID=3369 RepID=UPI0027DA12EC|nr:uncharacterized protein LOC131066126 isoform X2 [Cryptomeria japonica]
MASLSLNGAFSLSLAKSSVRVPGSSKPKHSLSISRIRVPCRAVISAPQVTAFPPTGHGFKSLCVTPASEGAYPQVEPPPHEEEADEITAIPTVMKFYQGLNRKDVKAVTELLAENCVLNDSQFPGTFEGKKMVLKFVKDLVEAMGNDILFVVEEVSEGDDLNVAVIWHLECEGKALPFTKGCSFYHCEKQGERMVIRSMQDFMEPPLKPGQLILNF